MSEKPSVSLSQSRFVDGDNVPAGRALQKLRAVSRRSPERIFPREFPSWQQPALPGAQGVWDLPFLGNLGWIFLPWTHSAPKQSKWSCFPPGGTFQMFCYRLVPCWLYLHRKPSLKSAFYCKGYKCIFQGLQHPWFLPSCMDSLQQVPDWADQAGDQVLSLYPDPVPTFLTCIPLKMQCQPGLLTQNWNFSICTKVKTLMNGIRIGIAKIEFNVHWKSWSSKKWLHFQLLQNTVI